MGSLLEGWITRLESRAEALGLTEEAWERHVYEKVLSCLSPENLDALDDVFAAAIERGATTVTFEELYKVSSERGRQALDAYKDVLEAFSRGEELPPIPPAGERTPWS